jgi:hypothetical protein
MTSLQSRQPVVVSAAGPCSQLTGALSIMLTQLAELLGDLTPEQYTTPAGELFMNATIGGHVRHTLDHIAPLTPAAPSESASGDLVDYDLRARGTPIESDPRAARAQALRLIAGLRELATADPSHPLTLRVTPSRDGSKVAVNSTLARELAFALSHTVHHAAILRIMLTARGIHTPAEFGFAPSTLAHLDAMQCAR